MFKLLKHRRVRQNRPLGVIKHRSLKEVPVVKHDARPGTYVLVGDYAQIEKEIRVRFIKIQQNPLKSIAKAIIQRVEPSKQKCHPYTMSCSTKKGQPGEKPGKSEDIPTKIRSPWWPANIDWKEPDHLKKPGMYLLLTVDCPELILCNRTNPTPCPHRTHVHQEPQGVSQLP